MNGAWIAADGLVLYGAVGLIVALGFVTIGLRRAAPGLATATIGARLLFLPGAALLWPLIIRRWLGRRRG